MKNNSYISKETIENITRRVILEEIRSKYSNIIKEDQQEDQESLFNKGDYIMYSKESYPENYLKIKKINNTAKQYTVDEISVNKKGEYFYTKDREAPFLFINQDYEKNGKKISEQEYEEALSNYYDGSKKSSAETEKAEEPQDILTSPETVDDIQTQSGNANVSRKDIKKILANILAKIKEKTGNKKISLKKVREIISAIANRLKKNYNLDDESLSRMYDDISTSVTSDSSATPEEPAQPAAATSGTDTATAASDTAPDADTTPDTEDDKKEKGASAWEKTKYIIAKAGGRYKVNGKFFGKKKIRQEEKKKVEALLQKTSNTILKDVDTKIKQAYPEFPNNELGKDFLSGVEQIASIYDTIVEKTKKEGADQLPVDLSNEMINDLREYVKNLLDVELKAFYATVDEQKEHEEYVEMLLEDAAADLRAKLKADREKRGGGKGKEDEFQSAKMKTLRSNKLPGILTSIGGVFGAYSWIANTEWFKDLFTVLTPENYTEVVQEASTKLYDIKDGEGVYKMLSRVTDIPLDANTPPEDLVKAFSQVGGGDANKGVELWCQKGGVMMKPDAAAKGLKEFLKNPNEYKNLGEFFTGQASGTGKLVPTDTTLYGTISGRKLSTIVLNMVPKILPRMVPKVAAKYAVAKTIGNVLGPIGVGLLVAGVTVKLMRMKGLKTSRAATLNALYQALRNIPGGEIVEPQGQVDTSIEPPVINITEPTATSTATTEPTAPSTTEPAPSATETEPTSATEPTAPATTEPKPDTTEPEPSATEPEKPEEKEKKADKKELEVSGEYDKLYKILRSTFRYIGDNKDTLYKQSTSDKEEPILEGRYIQSKKAFNYISDKIGYKKVESFEKLIAKIEAIKQNVNLLPPGVDKDLDTLVVNMKKNPLFAMNLRDVFNVEFAETERLEELIKFIQDVFAKMYKKNIGDKNLTKSGYELSKVSLKKKKEDVKEVSYIATSSKTPKLGDVKYSTGLLRNVLVFLMDSFKVFQYLHKLKNNISGTVDTTATSGSSVESPKTKSSATDVSSSSKEEKKAKSTGGKVYKLSDTAIDRAIASKENKNIMRDTRATIKSITDKTVTLNLYRKGLGTDPVERKYKKSEWEGFIKNGRWEIEK